MEILSSLKMHKQQISWVSVLKVNSMTRWPKHVLDVRQIVTFALNLPMIVGNVEKDTIYKIRFAQNA